VLGAPQVVVVLGRVWPWRRR